MLREYASRNRTPVRVCVNPLPSTLAPACSAPDLADALYFVSVGTLDPRKNHALLLRVWPTIYRRTGARLVLVGGVGGAAAPVWEELARVPALAASTCHVAGLSRAALAVLIAGARAALIPSFAEGYGLPVVEALTLGTPTLATDSPVFREASQGAGIFLDPRDDEAWTKAILHACARRTDPPAFVPPSWGDFHQRTCSFVDSLP